MSLLLALIAVASAATPWWCADEPAADELRAALAALWPEGAVEVRVGPAQGPGLRYEAGELVLVGAARELRATAPADVATQVLLARSWSREIAALDAGWIPAPPPEPPPEPPALAPLEPRPRARPRLELGVGAHDVQGESTAVDGPRLAVRARWPGFALEADAFVATAWTVTASELEETLLEIGRAGAGDLELASSRTTGSVELLLSWSPARGDERGRAPRVEPSLLVGATAAATRLQTFAIDAEGGTVTVNIDPKGGGWAAGPAVGAGLAVGLSRRLAIRGTAVGHALAPVAGARLDGGFAGLTTLGLDLLVALE